MNRRVKADLALVLCSVIWGASFVVVKFILLNSSPLVFMALRFTLASLVMLPLYRRGLRKMNRAEFWAGVVTGMSLFGGYIFQTAGLVTTSASKGAFITGSSVAMVPILLLIFWRRAIGPAVWAGVAAAFVGLYFLTVPGGGTQGLVRGDFLVLIGAVAFALQIIFVSVYGARHEAGSLGFMQIATTAALSLLLLPVGALTRLQPARLHWNPLLAWAVAATAVLATAATFSMQAWGQQFTTATHAALIFALEPVMAVVTARLVSGERLSARAIAGAVLILAGILLAEIRPRAARRGEGENCAEQAPAPIGCPPS